MMPGSQSSDPVWIRIRPDSELLDPVRMWPEPKCLDLVWIRIWPDLKIVDPVHPYFFQLHGLIILFQHSATSFSAVYKQNKKVEKVQANVLTGGW